MEKITRWIQSYGEGLGIEKLPGHRPISSLAIPMMTLCIIEQLKTMDPSLNYDDLTDWAIKDAMKHVQVKCTMGLTNYSFNVSWVLLNVISCYLSSLLIFQREGTVILETTTNDGKELCGSAGRLMLPGTDVIIERPAKCLVKYYSAGSPREINKVVLYFYRPFYRGWLVPVTSRYTVGERGAEADGHSQLHGATV